MLSRITASLFSVWLLLLTAAALGWAQDTKVPYSAPECCDDRLFQSPVVKRLNGLSHNVRLVAGPNIKIDTSRVNNTVMISATGVTNGVINVKDFGATADGECHLTTAGCRDELAIAAALEALKNSKVFPLAGVDTGMLYFPPGGYVVRQPIHIDALSGIRIVGAGVGATYIINENASGEPAFNVSNLSHAEISHMQIIGAPIGSDRWPSGEGIRLAGVYNILVDDVIIDRPGSHGISLAGVGLNTFHRVMVFGAPPGKSAFYFPTGSIGTSIINCWVQGDSSDGVYLEPLAPAEGAHFTFKIIGGHFEACRYGVYLNSVTGVVMSGVGFEANTAADIRLGTPAFRAVNNVVIEGCFGNGNLPPEVDNAFLDLSNADHVVLMSSHSQQHKHGILRGGGNDITLIANTLTEP